MALDSVILPRLLGLVITPSRPSLVEFVFFFSAPSFNGVCGRFPVTVLVAAFLLLFWVFSSSGLFCLFSFWICSLGAFSLLSPLFLPSYPFSQSGYRKGILRFWGELGSGGDAWGAGLIRVAGVFSSWRPHTVGTGRIFWIESVIFYPSLIFYLFLDSVE